MATPIYSQEQVLYLMRAAKVNDRFEATDIEMGELISLVEDHDEDYEKIKPEVELEVSRLLLQVATERERTAEAIRERDEARVERDEVERYGAHDED